MNSINAANAKNQKNAHTSGRKSFARLRKEMVCLQLLYAFFGALTYISFTNKHEYKYKKKQMGKH